MYFILMNHEEMNMFTCKMRHLAEQLEIYQILSNDFLEVLNFNNIILFNLFMSSVP